MPSAVVSCRAGRRGRVLPSPACHLRRGFHLRSSPWTALRPLGWSAVGFSGQVAILLCDGRFEMAPTIRLAQNLTCADTVGVLLVAVDVLRSPS